MSHKGICKFSGEAYGLTWCDTGEHDSMFCVTCGTSLPSYMSQCFECQEAEKTIPHLQESLMSLRRSLVREARLKLKSTHTNKG